MQYIPCVLPFDLLPTNLLPQCAMRTQRAANTNPLECRPSRKKRKTHLTPPVEGPEQVRSPRWQRRVVKVSAGHVEDGGKEEIVCHVAERAERVALKAVRWDGTLEQEQERKAKRGGRG